MKKNLSILSIFFLTYCTNPRTGVIDIGFTNELTQKDLDDIQMDLKSQNVELEYTYLEFDSVGHLKKISASIDYKDGHKGSFKSQVLQDGDRPGFRREFSIDD
ncbi:hypothetical protein [Algoriphagus zhangzhouensis]|uniref:Uncharacterized protein n=1 Tax=Algoriphagus zhangzhouensis TaxID=1073327 RepID=A0A1M7Z4H2_9BACT|nr:hypothetical protein [Algoriphagus zhangzhouensis]TDY48528.1 hypothetical protein A8938_0213 [Algoriphagus zhangzhouensis]SHO59576.1 hypothetical protein SAMN04488108_0214 [Algoriphagus zhangzhouensis]